MLWIVVRHHQNQGQKLINDVCPANGKESLQVPLSTILQHLKKPWKSYQTILIEQPYYFCSDPSCDVVYFGKNDLIINKAELRTLVGVKEPENDALVHQPVNNVGISVSVILHIKAHHEVNGYSLDEWCNAEVEYHRSARRVDL